MSWKYENRHLNGHVIPMYLKAFRAFEQKVLTSQGLKYLLILGFDVEIPVWERNRRIILSVCPSHVIMGAWVNHIIGFVLRRVLSSSCFIVGFWSQVRQFRSDLYFVTENQDSRAYDTQFSTDADGYWLKRL